jgi:NAD-dependent SIR2 family protein deacetylase
MNNDNNNNNNNNNSNVNGFESFVCENSSGFITIMNNSFQLSFDDIWTNDDTILENEQKPQPKVIHGNVEGYDCIKCGEFYPMAELNMPNKTFCCYSCRNGL